MDTQSLQAFLAVADCQGFSRAADQLHLTQPAISKRIAVLEDQLGRRLFDRIGRRITLTEAGEMLMPRARDIVLAMEDSQRALANLSGEVGGRLRLATSHHIGLHRLPPLLRRYTRRHPEVELDLAFLDSEEAYQGVLDGRLDIAVVTLAPEPHEQLDVVSVWQDRMCLVCAADHPLSRKASLTFQELCRHAAVLPGPLTFTRTLLHERLAREGLALDARMSTNYLETLKMMCSVGLGWSFLPESMLDDDLIELNVDTPPLYRPLGYLVHKNRTLPNAARQLIAALDAVREAGADP